MKRLTKLSALLLALIFLIGSAFAQPAPTPLYYQAVEKMIKGERSYQMLYASLDSLKGTFIKSRSNVYLHVDRDIDAGYRHKRLKLELNWEGYQIDLLTLGDSIQFNSVSYTDGNKQDFEWNESGITQYLDKRNRLYGSTKTVADLTKELTRPAAFATHCGDGSPITKRGLELERLVKDENVDVLHSFLLTISPEEQAYGVAGFEMLERNGVQIPAQDDALVKYIKKRNGEVICCSGCMLGVVEKLYEVSYQVDNLEKDARLYNQLKADTLLKPSGYVNDFEDLFTDEQERYLERLIADYEKQSTNEIVIVTLSPYMAYDVDFDKYALYLLNKWGVGKKGKNNGILIAISEGLKRMRIQNGYGIEAVLSDQQTKQIIDQLFIPRFKRGDYYKGVLDGVTEIMKIVR